MRRSSLVRPANRPETSFHSFHASRDRFSFPLGKSNDADLANPGKLCGPGKGAGVGHGDTPILVFGKPISSLSAEIPKRLFVPFFFFFPYSDANILNLYTKGVKVGRSRGRKKRVG